MLLKAPYIVTMEGGPLKDHAILVRNGIIQNIAPQTELKAEGECLELPGMILSPGLVNCHCHLELSQLPEPLPFPGSFVGWIDQLTRLKLKMTAESTESAIRFGIQKLLEGGTTTVADHMSVGTSPQPLMESALEGIIYAEVMGVEKQRAENFYEQALEKQKSNIKDQKHKPKFEIILTPHATYSLLPEIFSKIISHPVPSTQYPRTTAPFSIHISESPDEYLLFKEGRGPLFEFLHLKGKAPATIGETPVQYLQRLHLLPKSCMAIHANYLEDEDITILNEYNVSVIHCPGPHAYFGYDRFPLGLLQDAEINVALGTDSLASNASLSLFEQMRLVLENYAELTPESVLKMATRNGALALRKENEIGSLKIGKRANILGVPFRFPKKSVYENILLADKAGFSMTRGECHFGANTTTEK